MMQGRYELKFLITPAQQRRFVAEARSGLKPDPHGEAGGYRVSSLYFDTPDYAAYWEKVDGEAVRSKYRLRYYSHDAHGGPKFSCGFMEIKHRIDNTVYKQRVRLTGAGTRAILADPGQLTQIAEYVDVSRSDDRVTLDQIRLAALNSHLQPAAVITYLREAWQGVHDERLRVTFDTQCQAYAPHAYARVADATGEPLVQDERVIMEIKFDAAIPCWIRDILSAQGHQLQRFSKYATGVEAPARRQCLSLVGESPQPQAEPVKTQPATVAPVSTG